MKTLDAEMIEAHAAGDAVRLAWLYTQAANAATDCDVAGFYLTHAYVFALEAGDPSASGLRARLVEMGRETPLYDSATI